MYVIGLLIGIAEARLRRQQSTLSCKTVTEVPKKDALIWGGA